MYSLPCAGSNSPYDLVFSKVDAGPVQLSWQGGMETKGLKHLAWFNHSISVVDAALRKGQTPTPLKHSVLDRNKTTDKRGA